MSFYPDYPDYEYPNYQCNWCRETSFKTHMVDNATTDMSRIYVCDLCFEEVMSIDGAIHIGTLVMENGMSRRTV